MQLGTFTFPDDLLYDREHNWARVNGSEVVQGMTDFGQSLAGEIVYAEMPRVGRQVKAGEPFMSMESGKWVGRVKAIVGGKITAANPETEADSTIINHKPYGAGWLARISIGDPAELETLMRPDGPEFAAFIGEQRAKYKK
jgi:glycine cleavage system H protein